MRQSTKFLFVLFALCSLFGAFFIGGCSDETNVTEADAESKVIGSIEGIVTDATNNNPVAGATVTVVLPNTAATNPKAEAETQAAEETITATTDANGYYLIENKLGSGEYTVIFTIAGYFSSRQVAYIPTLEEIVQNDSPPKGDVPYRDKEDEALWPTASAITVTGQLVAPAPSPELKDDPNVMAAGAAVANVQVTLDFETYYEYLNGYSKSPDDIYYCGYSFFPNVFTATTDANGNFTFTGVPATHCAILRIPPYKVGPVQYTGDQEFFDLWAMASGGTADLGTFVSSVTGPNPEVTSYNFSEANWPLPIGANLVVTFSRPMNIGSVVVDLDWSPSTNEPFALSWDVTNTILTINPNLSLRPANPTSGGYNYDVTIQGQADNGRSLSTWYGYFRTIDGIAFTGTNLDNFGPVGDEFSDFPLDQPIVLDFSMPANLNNPSTYIDFDFDKKKAPAGLTLDSVIASGNTVTIYPNGILESAAEYCLDFVIYSGLRNDYATDDELTGGSLCFYAENTDVTPGNVTNFVLDEDASDYPADWNSTDFTFLWNRVPGARYYDLYAKDNSASLAKGKLSDGGTLAAGNPEYLLIATVNDADYLTRQTVSIGGNGVPGGTFDNLGENGFDLYDDDGIFTPFSGGLEITFAVKARNAAGSSIGFSNAITVADEVAPAFNTSMVGDADNSRDKLLATLPGDADTTFILNIDPAVTKAPAPLEYLQFTTNPVFTVQEAGGDDNYRISESQISWAWANDVRDGVGTVVVPVGEVGSGDRLIVQLRDNSGNLALDTMFFGPVIEYVSPTEFDTTWEAPEQYVGFDVDRTDVTGATGYEDGDEVRVYISFDAGVTWIDTLTGYDFDDGDEADIWYAIDDTIMVDGTAKIGVQRFETALDTAFGAIWGSDEFTINGIKVTSPDSAWVANNPWVFDAGGTDSTAIDIQWTSVGLNEVLIQWEEISKGANAFVITDTVMAADGQFMWYAPDLGYDYTVAIRVADNDSDFRPWGYAPMTVDVVHDEITVIHPVANEVAPEGADFNLGFNVEWWNLIGGADTLPSLLTIDYGYADGYSWSNPTQMDSVFTTDVSWTNIFTDTDNDGIENWAAGNIPKTMPTDSAFLRFWSLDDAGQPAIHAYSPRFAIAGLKMFDPNGAEEIEAGSDYEVFWRNYGNFDDDYTLQYTLNGTTWLTAQNAGTPLTAQTNSGNNLESVNWTVPQNIAQAGVQMRIMSSADNTIVDVTDSAFSITGFNFTFPATTGHNYFLGTLDSVKWAAVGSFNNIDLEFWVDDTVDGSLLMTPLLQNNPNTSQTHVFAPTSLFAITNPLPAAGFNAWILVKNTAGGGTAQDSISVKFTRAALNLGVPDGGQVWQRNTSHAVTWTQLGFGAADSVRIELSANSGGTYPTTIVEVPFSTGTYSWLIDPGTAPLTTYRIRITRLIANVGDGVTDESTTDFEITL